MHTPLARLLLLFALTLQASLLQAEAISCADLPHWSDPIPTGTGATAQVNEPHIFCGEPGRRNRAKGFHSVPGGLAATAPEVYVRHGHQEGPNAQGVYILRDLELRFQGRNYAKFLSTMFPDHCVRQQVLRSIVYANAHNAGSCSQPHWAVCGPSAPPEGGEAYCVGADGKPLRIATAPKREGRINTGFPVFE